MIEKSTAAVSKALWRPNIWIAVGLGLFLQPLGMLYVRRVGWALFYLFLGLVVVLSEFALRSHWDTVWLRYFPFSSLVMIACALHVYHIARHVMPTVIRPWYSRWYGLAAILAAFVAANFINRAFIFEPFAVPAGSMAPSLDKGSTLIARKWGYGNYGAYGVSIRKAGPSVTIARGDVLVFEFPSAPELRYVKRIVGLPGDTIRYKNKKLFINGVPAEKMKLSSQVEFDIFLERLGEVEYPIAVSNNRPVRDFDFNFKVPEGAYFVLGDNRDYSNDSRYWGPVPAHNIVGKVVASFR